MKKEGGVSLRFSTCSNEIVEDSGFSGDNTRRRKETIWCGSYKCAYLQLLIIAGPRLVRSLELLAHLGDVLVRLGELCGRHFECAVNVSRR
jgi:hypothetical protein